VDHYEGERTGGARRVLHLGLGFLSRASEKQTRIVSFTAALIILVMFKLGLLFPTTALGVYYVTYFTF